MIAPEEYEEIAVVSDAHGQRHSQPNDYTEAAAAIRALMNDKAAIRQTSNRWEELWTEEINARQAAEAEILRLRAGLERVRDIPDGATIGVQASRTVAARIIASEVLASTAETAG